MMQPSLFSFASPPQWNLPSFLLQVNSSRFCFFFFLRPLGQTRVQALKCRNSGSSRTGPRRLHKVKFVCVSLRGVYLGRGCCACIALPMFLVPEAGEKKNRSKSELMCRRFSAQVERLFSKTLGTGSVSDFRFRGDLEYLQIRNAMSWRWAPCLNMKLIDPC